MHLRSHAIVCLATFTILTTGCGSVGTVPAVESDASASDAASAGDGAPAIDGGAAADLLRAGGDTTCVLRGGRVTCWGGDRPEVHTVALPAAARDLDVGAAHACALLVDGRLTCWGRAGLHGAEIGPWHGSPEPTLVPVEGGTPEGIAVGDNLTCTFAGATLRCFGRTDTGLARTIDVGAPIRSVRAAGHRVCAEVASATANLDLRCFGDAPSLAPFAQIAASEARIALDDVHICVAAVYSAVCITATDAFAFNSQARGFGYSDYKTPKAMPILAPMETSVCLADIHGVDCSGANLAGEAPSGPPNAGDTSVSFHDGLPELLPLALVAGGRHRCLLAGRDVRCFGANDRGQLGTGAGPSRTFSDPTSFVALPAIPIP
jgi:serine/threonine-protein kinase